MGKVFGVKLWLVVCCIKKAHIAWYKKQQKDYKNVKGRGALSASFY